MHPTDVAAIWPLTGVSFGPDLPAGPDRRVVEVSADQGRFVAKLDGRPRPDLDDADRLLVLDYLTARRFLHAPTLVRTRTGHRVARVGGGIVCILRYVPHGLDERGDPQAAWAELGQVAARLNAYSDYPEPFAVPLRQALGELAGRAAGQPFEGHYLRLVERVAGLALLPASALVHGEINFANARSEADGTVVLLDWDQAGCAPAVIDYGYPLITAFLAEATLAFDDRAASAFYGSYADAGGTIDHRHLFSAALFAALRYLWWGDLEHRWERICHAVEHETELCDGIPLSPAGRLSDSRRTHGTGRRRRRRVRPRPAAGTR